MDDHERYRNLSIIAHAVGPFGGQEKAIEDFALHAKSLGIDVGIVAYKVSDEIEKSGIQVQLLKNPRSIFLVRFIWFWLNSPSHIRKLPPAPLVSCGAITRTKVDAAWMHFWHADHLKSTRWFTSWEGNLMRFLSQTSSRIVALAAENWMLEAQKPPILLAVSDAEGRALEKKYPRAKLIVLPNPVVKIDTPISDGFKSDSDTSPRIIFVGGAWGHKGLIRVAQAASELGNRRDSQIRLTIVGKGAPKLVERIGRLKNLTVEHVPWTDKVTNYLTASDLFMIASSYETFSMAGHEALAAGLPIVSTDVYGLAEAIRSTGLGIVTDRKVENLVHAADVLLWRSPPTLIDRERAISWINNAFSEEVMTRQREHAIQLLMKLAADQSWNYRDEDTL